MSDGYLALVDRRNSIVHDNWRGDLSSQELNECFDVGIESVEELGRLVAARALPIDDPMRLFNDKRGEPTEACG